MKKRVISLILAGCMIFTAIPCEVYADEISQEPDITASAMGTATEGVEISGNAVIRYRGTATDVVIPEGVTEIRSYAFKDCTNLESIVIPESVDTIGVEAFKGCSNLESIVIPSGVTAINQSTFFGCSKLESITIPESVDTIGVEAFYNCSNLESITIPESVDTIGTSAFNGCSKLESITIPSGVTAIAGSTFQGCSNLESITIPESVGTIGEYAFYNCSNLGSITIPESVGTIGKYAFYSCSQLESIEIPSGVTAIADETFNGCSNLESITIPESVDTIGAYTFQGCSSLENIEIPAGVTTIGKYAFFKCSQLESIEIPSGVTEIKEWTFYNCTNLESIEIPAGVTRIGKHAFNSCSNLESIKIPQSVTTIDETAFNVCSKLKITGRSGSYAETYAKDQGISFEKFYIVTFDANGGMNLSESQRDIKEGEQIGTFPTVEQAGCRLKGWYTETAGGTKAAETDVVKADTKLYAQWEILLENAEVTLSDTSYTYDGTRKEPAVTVKIGGQVLQKDRDYTVTYEKNQEAGTAQVVVTGTGSYTGTVTKDFVIHAAPLKNAEVTLSNTSYTYDGTAKEPAVTVKISGQVLQKDRDYTVMYKENQEAGTAQVVVTGTGNYTGTLTKDFTIGATSLKNAKVTLSNTSYTYNGKAKTPGITVKLGNKTLSKDRDYTVTYKKNKNIGTASVTITGKNNYSGTLSRTFTIKAGKNFNSGKYKYKVTGTSTVAFNGIVSKKTTKVTIPSTVKYGGKTFKVTSVAGSALKGKTKVTQVTVGKNVKTIGASAFNQCKSLKNITIESTKLKSVGKKAFQGISSKAKIKVPKKKLSAYQKLLKGKGQGNKVKIVKK